ncbi:MAG: DUF4233 domain-containing protein [Streptosporangiaceae bacterium]|nr:DUF4233 domain-containing protein [Actinomycetota bacterium]
MKRLCAAVLIAEAVVLGLAIPVAIHIERDRPSSVALALGVAAAAAVLFAALARPAVRLTLVGGTVLQIFVIVSGVIVPVMFFLGALFAALWLTGIWLARRWEGMPQ